MTIADKAIIAVAILMWVIAGGMIAEYNRRSETLFRMLEKHFPDYYKKVGRPLYSSFNIFRNNQGNYYRENLVFSGIPEDFPRNKALRRFAEKLRNEGIRAYMAIAFSVATIVLILAVRYLLTR